MQNYYIISLAFCQETSPISAPNSLYCYHNRHFRYRKNGSLDALALGELSAKANRGRYTIVSYKENPSAVRC